MADLRAIVAEHLYRASELAAVGPIDLYDDTAMSLLDAVALPEHRDALVVWLDSIGVDVAPPDGTPVVRRCGKVGHAGPGVRGIPMCIRPVDHAGPHRAEPFWGEVAWRDEAVADLIEASSLGTPEARRHRSSTPREVRREILTGLEQDAGDADHA